VTSSIWFGTPCPVSIEIWQKDRHPRLPKSPSRQSRLVACFPRASLDPAKFRIFDLVAVHDYLYAHVLAHENVAFMPAILGTPLSLLSLVSIFPSCQQMAARAGDHPQPH
jgi:hypothetical protein